MNLQDPQVVLWTKWDGLTALAAGHMQYSCFDHDGHSGGSYQQFTPEQKPIYLAYGWGGGNLARPISLYTTTPPWSLWPPRQYT